MGGGWRPFFLGTRTFFGGRVGANDLILEGGLAFEIRIERFTYQISENYYNLIF